jgi:SAM-dependent methyltransferase
MNVDIGCGRFKKEGFIGIDMQRLPGVDIVSNVDYGIPLVDDSVDEIYCSHTIEHLGAVDRFLRELCRVCRKGALIELRMPYYSYRFALNPGHKYTFSDDWFAEVIRNHYGSLMSLERVEYKECPGIRTELERHRVEFEFAKRHFNNVIEDFTVYLRVSKSVGDTAGCGHDLIKTQDLIASERDTLAKTQQAMIGERDDLIKTRQEELFSLHRSALVRLCFAIKRTVWKIIRGGKCWPGKDNSTFQDLGHS